jgi:hypothetical protein
VSKEFLTNTLFEEDYWLNCVAPGSWSSITIEQNKKIVGRLPYFTKSIFGIKSISLPMYTPWMGPWIRREEPEQKKFLSFEHEILAQMAKKMPLARTIVIACAPEYRNLMALHWSGYRLGLAYTYRITDLSDPDRIWYRMRDKTRNIYRKADRSLIVNDERSLKDITPILASTLARKGLNSKANCEVLSQIDAVMSARNQRQIYVAEDSSGKIHGFCYIVFDERHSFYLAGGADPSLRHSGAQTLALWYAIKNAGRFSRIFDFEGSMIPGIEHFFNGFGASQTPRFTAIRKITVFDYLISSIKSGSGSGNLCSQIQ